MIRADNNFFREKEKHTTLRFEKTKTQKLALYILHINKLVCGNNSIIKGKT